MAFARCNLVITNESGDIVDDAVVEVRRESDLGLAALFSDRAGTDNIGNSFVATDGADAGFHVVGGAYKITATLGAFERIWRYVAIGTAAESDASAFVSSAVARTRLDADTTWYVNHASGSNTLNDGRSAGSPFATVQHAANVIYNQVDANGFLPTIQIAAGTFTENNCTLHGRIPGTSRGSDTRDIKILGNTTTPGNVVWQVSAGAGLIANDASVLIEGVRLVGTASGVVGLQSWKNACLIYKSMEFGAFASGIHINILEGGLCYFDGGSYRVDGNMAEHVAITGTGEWIMQAVACSVPNALTFTNWLHVNGPGFAQTAAGVTFTGTGSGAGSTGKQYRLRNNGVYLPSGVTLPGATAGTTESGGQAN